MSGADASWLEEARFSGEVLHPSDAPELADAIRWCRVQWRGPPGWWAWPLPVQRWAAALVHEIGAAAVLRLPLEWRWAMERHDWIAAAAALRGTPAEPAAGDLAGLAERDRSAPMEPASQRCAVHRGVRAALEAPVRQLSAALRPGAMGRMMRRPPPPRLDGFAPRPPCMARVQSRRAQVARMLAEMARAPAEQQSTRDCAAWAARLTHRLDRGGARRAA